MPPNTGFFVDPVRGDWFVSVIPSGKKYGFKFAVPADEEARFYLTFRDDADIVWQIDNDLHLEKARQR